MLEKLSPDARKRIARAEVERRRRAREYLRQLLPKLVEAVPGERVSTRQLSKLLMIYLGHRPYRRELGQILSDMGGLEVRDENRRYWDGLRLRVTPAAKEMVLAEWEKRLLGEGLPKEPIQIKVEHKVGPDAQLPQPLRNRVEQVHLRRSIHGVHFDRAAQYYWDSTWGDSWEQEVWRLYAIDGLAIRDVAKKLNRASAYIGRVIQKHKARAGLL